MADYAQTPSLVLASAAALRLQPSAPWSLRGKPGNLATVPGALVAGCDISAGMPVYRTADDFLYLARATLQAAQTTGTLVIGRRYIITTFVAGDDFVNVGGTNVTGTIFTATGTTPTTWTHASTLNDADPVYKVEGVAENTAAKGQPLYAVYFDPDFQPGCALAVGDAIIVSNNAGKMSEDSAKGTGWYVSSLGVATSTAKMALNITRADAIRL